MIKKLFNKVQDFCNDIIIKIYYGFELFTLVELAVILGILFTIICLTVAPFAY
jgi:hypothetical protein